MSLLDHVDADDLEARLRAGQFQSLEQVYDWIEQHIGFRPDAAQARILKASLFPEERAILGSLPQREGMSVRKYPTARRSMPTRPKKPKPPPRKRGTPKVVLTPQDVLAIRADFVENGGHGWYSRTAKEYGVRHNTISDIVNRKTWKEV